MLILEAENVRIKSIGWNVDVHQTHMVYLWIKCENFITLLLLLLNIGFEIDYKI